MSRSQFEVIGGKGAVRPPFNGLVAITTNRVLRGGDWRAESRNGPRSEARANSTLNGAGISRCRKGGAGERGAVERWQASMGPASLDAGRDNQKGTDPTEVEVSQWGRHLSMPEGIAERAAYELRRLKSQWGRHLSMPEGGRGRNRFAGR